MKSNYLRSFVLVLAVAGAALSQAQVKQGATLVDVSVADTSYTGGINPPKVATYSLDVNYAFQHDVTLGVGYGYGQLSGVNINTYTVDLLFYAHAGPHMSAFIGPIWTDTQFSGGNGTMSSYGGEVGLLWHLAKHLSLTPEAIWTTGSLSGNTVKTTSLKIGLTYWF